MYFLYPKLGCTFLISVETCFSFLTEHPILNAISINEIHQKLYHKR